ncbi:hypothetical protein BDP81DRAFT_434739 [Colletotrichum phormii]|uniref:Uncharacterized protein n=1 Tax=Colletotrichum phormii TaxID=359342 RepID=A0AAJ0EDR5_9PEZI|nr:uncharacterized protein BDP81DRAFT_434739 [Colletotrichum phormii]KAK1633356.1 hypothetical protein BDP81DRAFT_434739 [Colletotrichum phormii]
MLSMASTWRIRAQSFGLPLSNGSVVNIPIQAGSLARLNLHLGDSLPAGHLGDRAASGHTRSALWVQPRCKLKLLRSCGFRPQTPCYAPDLVASPSVPGLGESAVDFVEFQAGKPSALPSISENIGQSSVHRCGPPPNTTPRPFRRQLNSEYAACGAPLSGKMIFGSSVSSQTSSPHHLRPICLHVDIPGLVGCTLE